MSAAGPLWIHGASVGDLRALGPLIASLQADGHALHLSATTASGRATAAQLYPGCPLSGPPLLAPARALAWVRPRLLILEYLELWPGWIRACDRAGVPVAVVDGRITHRSLRVAPLLRRAAGRLSLFCAQTAADAAAAAALGVPADRIWICGNGKHDRAAAPPQPTEALRQAIGPRDLVVGCLHEDEEAAALPALAARPLRVLLAPRYPARARALRAAARRLGVPVALRSQPDPGARWLILDTLGELAAAYALAPVALIGGGFGGRGGQNLVEAAAHGRPVIYGPNTANIAVEAAALAGRGGWPVASWPEAVEAALARLERPGPDPRPALADLRGAVARQRAQLAPLLGVDPQASR